MLASLPPLLVPTPRSVTPARPARSVRVRADADSIGGLDTSGRLTADGYTLTIAPDPPVVHLGYASPAGLGAGRATLRQLQRQYGDNLPCLAIEDWPEFPTRGVMLDISRDKVPSMGSLRRAAADFAALKLNHLQLYTEHAFAYPGHEEVWLDASPITPDDARDLDSHCRSLGVELAANQNCMGHLSRWLNLNRYAHLAETHGDWMFMHWPRSGPFSLCPTDPASLDFVRGLLSQLAPCFRSPLVNIGCDEAFDVGAGRSRAAVEERGRAAVYFDFVRGVARAAEKLGKQPMIWADIALSHPEALGQFPEGAIGLAWGYEPDAEFGSWCERLGHHGIPAWVCPGTSSWRSITGRTSESRANIAAAGGARSAGAAGFMVTDWGDLGHHQHWPIALNAIAHAAQAAWNPGARTDPRAVSLHVLGDESLELAGWLDRLGDIDLHIRAVAGDGGGPIRNASALFRDLHRARPLSDPIPAAAEAWEEAADNLAACERSLPAAPERDSIVAREIAHTLAVARLAVEHALADRRGCSTSHRDRLAGLGVHVAQEHERLWLLRNRPGGLSRSTHHYHRLVDRMRSLRAS